MSDKYGPCWAELMENETQESLADLYVGQLVGIAHLEAENAALKAQVQRLSAPVSAPVTTEVAAKCGNRIYVGTTGESSCEQPLGHSGSHRQGKFEWQEYGKMIDPDTEDVPWLAEGG
jgi:hypothetical protein